MKLKKITLYIIIIIAIPLLTLNHLQNKYKNNKTLRVTLNYNDLRSENHFILSPVYNGINDLYDDILNLKGVTKSSLPLYKRVETNYSKFLFDIIDN